MGKNEAIENILLLFQWENSIIVKKDKILSYLPHRHPTLLVNQVGVSCENKMALGIGSKKYLHSFYPTVYENSVPLHWMEGIFQTAGILTKILSSGGKDKRLMSFQNLLLSANIPQDCLSGNDIMFLVYNWRNNSYYQSFTGEIYGKGQQLLQCQVHAGSAILS